MLRCPHGPAAKTRCSQRERLEGTLLGLGIRDLTPDEEECSVWGRLCAKVVGHRWAMI